MSAEGKRWRRKWWWILLLIPLASLLWYRITLNNGAPPGIAGIKAEKSAANAEAQAGRPADISTIQNPAPAFRKLEEIELSRYESAVEYGIAGRVTSESGDPLPGTTITIYRTASVRSLEFEDPLASASCDSTGHYRIPLNSPLTSYLKVEKPGYAHLFGRFDVRFPGFVTLNYSLREATARVEGKVFEEGGRPLSGALVAANLTSGYLYPNRSVIGTWSVRTDSSGRYALSDLPAERIDITASANGHSEKVKTIDLKTDEFQSIDFELFPAAQDIISVVVRNAEGKGIPFAIVSGRPPATADENGVATVVVNSDSGPFKCRVRAAGYKEKTLALDPKARSMEVVLDKAELFTGRVLSESGAPLPGVSLQIRPSQADGDVTSDSLGMFSVPLLDAPIREVVAGKPGYITEFLLYYDDKQKCPPFMEITLKRTEGGIYGRVIDEEGKPVALFSVVLRDFAQQSPYPRFARFFDNEEGLFSITEVPAGRYGMSVMSIVDPTTKRRPQSWESNQVELRKGLYFGEMLIQLASRPNPQK